MVLTSTDLLERKAGFIAAIDPAIAAMIAKEQAGVPVPRYIAEDLCAALQNLLTYVNGLCEDMSGAIVDTMADNDCGA